MNTGGLISNRIRIEQNLNQTLFLAELQVFGNERSTAPDTPTAPIGNFGLIPIMK